MKQELHPAYIPEERRRVDALAREWQTCAAEHTPDTERGAFMRFIALWIAFNAVYVSRFSGSATDSEIEKIRQLAPSLFGRHDEHLRSDTHYKEAIVYFVRHEIYNCQRDCFFKIKNHDDTKECLTYIYYIRNNLFHGRKVPSKLHDYMLVQHAGHVLDRLLQDLLRDNNPLPFEKVFRK
jgi:hypothetical protein